MSLRVCAQVGCPVLSTKRRCKDHEREADRARGTRHERGYGAAHVRLRQQWAPKVATGTVRCARCGELIPSNEAWDLGHDDLDRTKYTGPEHAARCNRSAGGKAAHSG